MQQIKKLFLFIHFVLPDDASGSQYRAKWHELITTAGPDPDNALCILSGASNQKLNDIETELFTLAKVHFAHRCVLDPSNESDSTQLLLAQDLLNLYKHRGRFTQWTPYELWSSVMARKWTQGLKRELDDRGLSYDPQTLAVVSCGQQWAGCLTKYSLFFPKYLGLIQPAQVRVDLSTGAGWPLVNTRFVEHFAMDRHVSLYLFETADGRPMGQFLDGLRGVWEPLHVAVITNNIDQIEMLVTQPGDTLELQIVAPSSNGVIVADVGDGCQPRRTTLLGIRGGWKDFRAALTSARIEKSNPELTLK